MNKSGRFSTTTKLKIETPYGNILKVTTYPIDEDPYEDYKIRPKCSFCGGNALCMCFNLNNSDDPLQSAIENLKEEHICDSPNCICAATKKWKPEIYKSIVRKCGKDDIWAICDELVDLYGIDDDNELFCET